MANELAGQRATFTSAPEDFNTAEEESVRVHAIEKMAQVLADAPVFGFPEADVTQSRDVPAPVVDRVRSGDVRARSKVEAEAEDERVYLADVETAVALSAVREFGDGSAAVYAYGYACARNWLKIGRTDGDVVARVTAQINTSTPERPRLELIFWTDRPRPLERARHAWFEFRGRKVDGGGQEWFAVDSDHVVTAYHAIVGAG